MTCKDCGRLCAFHGEVVDEGEHGFCCICAWDAKARMETLWQGGAAGGLGTVMRHTLGFQLRTLDVTPRVVLASTLIV